VTLRREMHVPLNQWKLATCPSFTFFFPLLITSHRRRQNLNRRHQQFTSSCLRYLFKIDELCCAVESILDLIENCYLLNSGTIWNLSSRIDLELNWGWNCFCGIDSLKWLCLFFPSLCMVWKTKRVLVGYSH